MSALPAPAPLSPLPVATRPASPPVVLMAAGAGFAVASIYYAQPLLAALGSELGAGATGVGLVPTLTQFGYAAGLLLLAPLGDRSDRRTLITAKAAGLTLALLAAGFAPGLPALLLASLVIGLAATMAQDLVPAAAALSAPERRGATVGSVMTGLLLGILLSRVASGLLAALWGWRSVFFAAAAAVAVIGLAVWRGLPHIAPTTRLGYGALLASMVSLWRRHAALRRAAAVQGLLSVGFSAFWSTLALALQARHGLGAAAAGAFGLAGAAGALAAPLAGRLADRRGPMFVTRLAAALAVLSFAVLAAEPLLPTAAALALIALAAVGFDFAIQASLVSHQTLVYGLEPEARSRLNALLFTTIFVGMAAGSALGGLALTHGGWLGMVALASAASLAALVLRLRPLR
ncbi:MFS transporter [Rubrivivax gelatinosus]|uniref:Putative MFS family arabinose efflux permease n=1 Tax=Rubrivivax gelatinosus TaxID=28068 RepID=A0A4R2M6N0_RUBGE|nr:MFS transporter [Rubrivivax gelatinosus]MBK1687901.1 MFS transporter [Rubrivivax gelatinosus]TCP01751.1 putative MFS family arabinose efflux permease [Rubrivivax gelatinosus]